MKNSKENLKLTLPNTSFLEFKQNIARFCGKIFTSEWQERNADILFTHVDSTSCIMTFKIIVTKVIQLYMYSSKPCH